MTDYDDRGKVSIWKNESDNPKAPKWSGSIIAHRNIREGEEIRIALWSAEGNPKHENHNARAPWLRGKVSDKQARDAVFVGERQVLGKPAEDFDSDIPF